MSRHFWLRGRKNLAIDIWQKLLDKYEINCTEMHRYWNPKAEMEYKLKMRQIFSYVLSGRGIWKIIVFPHHWNLKGQNMFSSTSSSPVNSGWQSETKRRDEAPDLPSLHSDSVTHVVSENSRAWSLWEWLKEVAPGNLAHMNVLDISWFTDSMRERRPVTVETRHLIKVRRASCATAVFGWLGVGSRWR